MASALSELAGTILEALGGEEITVCTEVPSYRSAWPWDPSVVQNCLAGARRACLRNGALTGQVKAWMDYSLDVLAQMEAA